MKRSARTAATVARVAVQELCCGTGPSTKMAKQETKTTTKANAKMDKSSSQSGKPPKTVDQSASQVHPAPSSSTANTKKKAVAVTLHKKTQKVKKTAESLKLGREFFDQETIPLCKALLGTVLCRKIASTGEILRGTIVETEAYPGDEDQASQSYRGRRTPRNEAMYMDPGTAYVCFTYGMYYCFNISAKGDGAACLIRGIETHEDYETMHNFRSLPKKKPAKDGATNGEQQQKDEEKVKKRLNQHELANGPSKLCIAFDISRDKCDKIDMATSDELWLEHSLDMKFKNRDFEIALDKRIGIDSTPPEARNKLWRFYVKDSWSESRAKVGELKKKAKLQE